MRRRAYLTALSAAVPLAAGCATTTDGGGASPTGAPTEDGTTGTDAPTEADTPTTEPAVAPDTVVAANAPRTYALDPLRYRTFDEAVVEVRFVATATADHPALVRATLRNANPFPNTFRLEATPPFGPVTSDEGRSPLPWDRGDVGEGLVFAPTPNHDLAADPPAVERGADGYWRLVTDDGSGAWLPETVRLAPEETVTGEYALVGEPAYTSAGRPTGVYEFRRAREYPLRVAVWNTREPGPVGSSRPSGGSASRFAGASVPPFAGDASDDRPGAAAVWYHEADRTTPAYVHPETERTTLPARLRFAFVNHTREDAGCGHWWLYKLHDGDWFILGPYSHVSTCFPVEPGGTDTWTALAFHGDGVEWRGPTFEHLGGGRYAVLTGGSMGPWLALVEVDAPPVTVTPTDDVRAVHFGERVVVESPLPATSSRRAEAVHGPATLTVTRTDAAPDLELIAEQVMGDRLRGLRNTLPFFERGVEQVVLRTDERVARDAVGYPADNYLRFDGEAFVGRVEGR